MKAALRLTIAGSLIICSTAGAAKIGVDAFRSFDGSNGKEGITYGIWNGTDFAPFSATTPCLDARMICLRSSVPRVRLEVAKSTSGAFTAHGVDVPADELVLLTGRANEAVYVSFTAPIGATLNSTASFDLRNTSPAAAELSFFYQAVGRPVVITSIGSLDDGITGIGISMLLDLHPGDAFGYLVGGEAIGTVSAVGFNLTISEAAASVPEPSTWALWLQGFGILGLLLRSKGRLLFRAA